MIKDYSQLFTRFVSDSSYFLQAIEIARANSGGNIWIIGGFVFRNLAAALYSGVEYHSDIDLVSDIALNTELRCPIGWSMRKNSYGTPKFERGDYSIDLSSLVGWSSIERRKLRSSITNALSGTPLTVQSIAYDVQRQQILGEIGINAVVSRTVAVNNREQAEIYAERKKKPLRQIISEKAQALGFTPIYD
jgi:hypothetical protein